MVLSRTRVFVLLLTFALIAASVMTVFNTSAAPAQISGALQVWHPVTLDFAGPRSTELSSDPNPFLDYRLQVSFTGPGGQRYSVPGFFDGDGKGGSEGDVWRVLFTPDQAGEWIYQASFRSGRNIAVDLDPGAGTPVEFDGATDSFIIAPASANSGFQSWGRLEYANGHYLKFRDGPYWVKGGTDSPETLLGYVGFDDTTPGPFGLLDFADHKGDWQSGDPILNTNGADDGKGMIGALNYLASRHVNSIYFLPMNIGGDGQNVWPYAGDIDRTGSGSNDNTHFDLSKLRQWGIVFEHAQQNGIFLHVVLNEAEEANKKELDNGTLGVERKVYYRELVARFGHFNALQWNISEEYNHDWPLSPATVKEFAGYIQAIDPYDHPITVHNISDPNDAWPPFLGDERFSVTSFQLKPTDLNTFEPIVEDWRERSAAAGRPIPISLDELNNLAPTDEAAETQRKDVIWPVYLSGGMLEHYLGGPVPDKELDDFRRYEQLWDYTWYARKFVQDNLPFWQMQPNDGLLTNEATNLGQGEVFTKAGEVYAVYLPNASKGGTLDLSTASGMMEQRWFNPRTGEFEGSAVSVAAGTAVDLGMPPSNPDQDWVILLRIADVTDDQPPIISDIQPRDITDSTATITWTTDELSDSLVNFGLDTSYGGSASDPASVTSHSVQLTGLTANTTYHFQVSSTDGAGNQSVSEDAVFTTSGIDDIQPPVISDVQAVDISTDSATITWTTDEPSDSQVDWGLTNDYGDSASDGNSVTAHSILLTGLTANTTYHYQVSSTDGSGNLAVSSDYQFTTSVTPPDGSFTVSVTGVEEGQTVTGTIAIQAHADGQDVSRVDFELTGPQSTSWVERNAPYYFMGNNRSTGVPNGWDTTTYPDGDYTLTVTVTTTAGQTGSTAVHFRISHAPVVTGLSNLQEGQVLSGVVVIEAYVSGDDITQVVFELTGPRSMTWVEKNPPYYLAGNKPGVVEANGWDTTTHPDGDYMLTVIATNANGQTGSLVVHFQIDNSP